MIKTVIIDKLEDVTQLIMDNDYNPNIDRLRSSYFFRGMPDVSFNLVTSLTRVCKNRRKQLEPSILKNFTKYAIIEEPSLKDNVWQQMIMGQHHGLPTRLLDWTHSPLIALHFANSEDDLDNLQKRDCVVWRMDMRDMNQNLPQKYKDKLEEERTFVFSVESLNSICQSLEQYDKDMGNKSIVNLEPPSLDQRIINQYSFFSIIPSEIENLDDYLDKNTQNTIKYVIRKEIRWNLRDLLDQFNMNERMIYPGLDGLGKWLARHYYVKN